MKRIAIFIFTPALTLILILASLAATAEKPESQKSKTKGPLPETAGRYLVKIAGCNNCHSRGFIQSEGSLPESDWLTGDSMGWQGPWGTTYATNLRLFIKDLSEDNWVKFCQTLRGRPPMPFWSLKTMRDQDRRSIYRFIKSLGPKGENAPAYVPPGENPKTPYILFVPQPPK